MTDAAERLNTISKFSAARQQIALAALLAESFNTHDVMLTVVGGAAVQFYTAAEYVTKDLDAILSGDTTAIIESVMNGLGFKRTTTYRHFEHPLFPFVVEFPPSPVEVGGRHVDAVNVIEMDGLPVRVIRIEDIIMDRIIAGIEWKQESRINQAILLWVKNKKIIDKAYLKEFARKEGYTAELKKIMRFNAGSKSKP